MAHSSHEWLNHRNIFACIHRNGVFQLQHWKYVPVTVKVTWIVSSPAVLFTQQRYLPLSSSLALSIIEKCIHLIIAISRFNFSIQNVIVGSCWKLKRFKLFHYKADIKQTQNAKMSQKHSFHRTSIDHIHDQIHSQCVSYISICSKN